MPYVDTETGEILHETCGRCNRESHCGYHLTPSQYFQQNPGARPQGDAWRQLPQWLNKRKSAIVTAPQPQPSGPISELPKEIVVKTISFTCESNLVKYLNTLFDPLIVEGAVSDYQLGVTRNGETIFYQIDGKGRYRGGKIIQYNPATGHRIKGTDLPVRWVHTEFKSNLGDKLNVLTGRKILVYPDVDAFDEWSEWFAQRQYLDATISTYLEENCTDEDREAQVDIADLLIRWKQEQEAAVPPVPTVEGTEHHEPSFRTDNPVVRDVAKYFSPEVMPEVAALIEDLDLVPISIQRIEPTTDEDSN